MQVTFHLVIIKTFSLDNYSYRIIIIIGLATGKAQTSQRAVIYAK